MDPGQSLWKATYPPYLQRIFFFFFSKFLIFATSPTISIRFRTNFATNMIVMREYRLFSFLTICQKLKILCHFEFFVDSNFWVWKFQNATPTVFIRCQSNFMRALATMAEYRLLLFLAIGQVSRNFNMGVNIRKI